MSVSRLLAFSPGKTQIQSSSKRAFPSTRYLQELDSEVDLSESLVIWNEEQRTTTDNSITASFEGALIKITIVK